MDRKFWPKENFPTFAIIIKTFLKRISKLFSNRQL